MEEKLKLYGFNNLTKSLSFNIYDICYAKTAREQQDYIRYINEQYNSQRLTDILEKLTGMIGAVVLNISRQDYEPQGASVTCLIAEESMRSAHQRIHSVFPVSEVYQAHIPTYPSGHWLFGFASPELHPLRNLRAEEWNRLGIRTRYYNTRLHKGAFCLPTYVEEDLKPIE